MKYQLVICNHADRKECPKCRHAFIHNKKTMTLSNESCTSWTECYNAQGEYLFKVRCVSIESAEGEKVIEILKNSGELF